MLEALGEDDQDATEEATLLVDRNGEREITTTTFTTLDNEAESTREQSGMIMISRFQQYTNVAAHVLALTIIVVVYAWISKLGGLISPWQATGRAKIVFNWHPLLMVTAFSFMTVSSLSFRANWYKSDNIHHNNRNVVKLIHAMGWAVAALAATLGLLAVFQSHNDRQSGYIANMYSLHSWIGAGVILLYVIQFGVGLRAFGGPLASRNWTQPARAMLLRFHVVIGPMIYFLTGVTILLGIQEKEGFIGCGYKVDSPDLFPIQHIGKIPSVCLVSHILGILVFLTMIAVGLALADFRRDA